MAVPKKRTSKSIKRRRKTVWIAKSKKMAVKAFSQARSVLTGRSSSFYYATDDTNNSNNKNKNNDNK